MPARKSPIIEEDQAGAHAPALFCPFPRASGSAPSIASGNPLPRLRPFSVALRQASISSKRTGRARRRPGRPQSTIPLTGVPVPCRFPVGEAQQILMSLSLEKLLFPFFGLSPKNAGWAEPGRNRFAQV